MLDGFSLSSGDTVVTENDINSKKICTLIQYLLANRHKNISQENLIETLWPEDCQNPMNALKNLVYRARTALSAAFPQSDGEFIRSNSSTYEWADDIETVVDCEQFEDNFHASEDEMLTDDEKIFLCRKSLDCYSGEFLPKSTSENWVMCKNAYYTSLFIKVVETTCEMLYRKEMYADAIEICEKAVAIHTYEEKLHEYLIKSYSLAGRYHQAISHYYYITSLFYTELGAEASKSIKDLFSKITSYINNIELNLNTIEDDLKETDFLKRAFFCDYEVFKHIYRVNYRSIERSQKVVCLMLITLTDENGLPPEKSTLIKNMQSLKKTLQCILRKSDVFARYSASQYVVLLPLHAPDDSNVISRRINSSFVDELGRQNVQILIKHKIL